MTQNQSLVDQATFAKVQGILAEDDHHKQRNHRRQYLLRGLVHSMDAESPCLVTTQPAKKASYYRSKARINGSQVYYNCRDIDDQAGELIKSFAVQKESRPELEVLLNTWLDEFGKDDEESELLKVRHRLKSISNKKRNMALSQTEWVRKNQNTEKKKVKDD